MSQDNMDLLAEDSMDLLGGTTTKSTEKSQTLYSILKERGVGAGLGVATGAGIGLGAYGLTKGWEFLRQPKVRSELMDIKGQLKGIQEQIPSTIGQPNIEGTEATFLPKRLNQVSQNLKQQLNAFDETLVSLKSKDLASTIQQGHSTFRKSFHDSYSKGLDELDSYFQNKPITAESYANFLDNVIQRLYKKGLPESQIKPIENLRNAISPSKEYIIPFSQAKGNISGLVNQDPYSGTSGVLREQWGDFLSQNAPSSDVSLKLEEMNGKYKTFLKAESRLNKMFDKSGEFNLGKAMGQLAKYTRDRVDDGIVDLMKLLGENISGVKEKFSSLSQLKEKRFKNEDLIKQQLDKINNLREKSEELISRGNVLQEKLDSRNAAKILVKTFGLGKRALGMLSIIPQITDAIKFGEDPEAWFLSQYGVEPAKKGTLEREIQTGRVL